MSFVLNTKFFVRVGVVILYILYLTSLILFIHCLSRFTRFYGLKVSGYIRPASKSSEYLT